LWTFPPKKDWELPKSNSFYMNMAGAQVMYMRQLVVEMVEAAVKKFRRRAGTLSASKKKKDAEYLVQLTESLRKLDLFIHQIRIGTFDPELIPVIGPFKLDGKKENKKEMGTAVVNRMEKELRDKRSPRFKALATTAFYTRDWAAVLEDVKADCRVEKPIPEEKVHDEAEEADADLAAIEPTESLRWSLNNIDMTRDQQLTTKLVSASFVFPHCLYVSVCAFPVLSRLCHGPGTIAWLGTVGHDNTSFWLGHRGTVDQTQFRNWCCHGLGTNAS
jgi:hypothetical protein